MAAGDVFISYRRADTRWPAAALYDRLAARLGGDRVFKDIDDIEPGEDFVATLDEAVSRSAVVLVLMGDRWLDAADEHGNRRLDDPADFVRIEIATALRRGIRVIPVLVDAAEMPRGSDLPPDLAPLARMQAVQISAERMDVSRLLRVIEPILERAELTAPPVVVWDTEFVPREREPTAPVPPGPEPPLQTAPLESKPVEGKAGLRVNRRLLLLGGIGLFALIGGIIAIVAALQRPAGSEGSGSRPPALDHAVVVDAAGHRGYIATDDGVQVVDTVSREQVASLPAGSAASGLALSSGGGRLYVTDPQQEKVVIVDTATGEVTGSWDVHDGVLGIALDEVGGLAYLASTNDNAVLVLDLTTGAQRASIELTDSPVAVALLPSHRRLYALGNWTNTVMIVDTASRTQSGTIPVGSYPRAIAVDEVATRVYVSQLSRDGIAVIDPNGDQVYATIDLPGLAQGLAVDAARGRLYAALDAGGVAMIDTTEGVVLETLNLTGELRGIGIDPGDSDPTLVVSRHGAPAVAVRLSDLTSGPAPARSSAPPPTPDPAGVWLPSDLELFLFTDAELAAMLPDATETSRAAVPWTWPNASVTPESCAGATAFGPQDALVTATSVAVGRDGTVVAVAGWYEIAGGAMNAYYALEAPDCLDSTLNVTIDGRTEQLAYTQQGPTAEYATTTLAADGGRSRTRSCVLNVNILVCYSVDAARPGFATANGTDPLQSGMVRSVYATPG